MKFLSLVLVGMMFGPNLAQAQENDPCRYSCNQECEQYQLRLSNKLRRIEEKCGTSTPTPIPGSGRVELYKSDKCESELIGKLNPGSNCSKFAGNRAWGVKINGKCEDISDMNADAACEAFKGGTSNYSTYLYKSDKCESELVAIVDYTTDCQALSQIVTSRVWGIRSQGESCNDISDLNFADACERFKE